MVCPSQLLPVHKNLMLVCCAVFLQVSGNAAPMEKNLLEYLRRHPECEVFTGQVTVSGSGFHYLVHPTSKGALVFVACGKR